MRRDRTRAAALLVAVGAGLLLAACGSGAGDSATTARGGEREAATLFNDVTACFLNSSAEPLLLVVGQRSERFDRECLAPGDNEVFAEFTRPDGTVVAKISVVNAVGFPRVTVRTCAKCYSSERPDFAQGFAEGEGATFRPGTAPGLELDIRRLPDGGGGNKSFVVDFRNG
jgi:hypothetical protein